VVESGAMGEEEWVMTRILQPYINLLLGGLCYVSKDMGDGVLDLETNILQEGNHNYKIEPTIAYSIDHFNVCVGVVFILILLEHKLHEVRAKAAQQW
jgi:hypothetical protein